MDDICIFHGYQNDTEGNLRLQDIDYFKLHPNLTVTYLFFMAMSTFVGIIGNTMVIGSVCVCRKLRTKANIFIINLAIADTCVAFVVQGFSIIGLTIGCKFFLDKGWLCHAVATICLVSCSCSLWNMGAIAVNRFICICRKTWYHAIYTWKKSCLIAASLWIVCILLEFPNYFSWGGHTFDAKTMTCSYDRTADYTYTLFFVLAAIVPPLLVVLLCYLLIFIHVKKTRKTVKKLCAKITQRAHTWKNSELRLAKSLFIIFIVFLICWSPYAIVVLIDKYDEWDKIVYVIIIQMAHTNSSLNSIIYAASNKDFRDGYKMLLCCICERGRSKKTYMGVHVKLSGSKEDTLNPEMGIYYKNNQLIVPSPRMNKKISNSYSSLASSWWSPSPSPIPKRKHNL